MGGIEGRRRTSKLPRVLTVAKMKRLLNQSDPSDPRSLRDKALCELLYASGLRVSEIATLTVDDIDMEDHSLRCFGKGQQRAGGSGGQSGAGLCTVCICSSAKRLPTASFP